MQNTVTGTYSGSRAAVWRIQTVPVAFLKICLFGCFKAVEMASLELYSKVRLI